MNQVKICPCGIAADDCDYHKPQLVPNANTLPTYDVSGTSFIPMITQFTAENFHDALSYLQMTNKITHFTVHAALFSRIQRSYLLDSYPNGEWSFQGFVIRYKNTGKSANTFETDFCVNDQIVGKLITREAQ